ncbi:unnamed protein product [Dicrocoelium dendriticum]|nr:unnamed protein product [Dicrocoelium dendriticum]
MDTCHPVLDGKVEHVTIATPPFHESNLKHWFVQLEALFELRGIRSEILKYLHVVSALSPHVTDDIDDILELPAERKTYEEIKAAILKRTGLSDRQRITKLLSETELGDLKPSQLLRKMQSLVKPDMVDDTFLKEMRLRRLPCEMCNILYANAGASLTLMADIADQIWESYGQISQVRSMPKDDIAALTKKFADFTISGNSCRCRSSNRQRPSRSKSPPKSPCRMLVPSSIWPAGQVGPLTAFV